MYQQLWSHDDGRTNGRKKWHIEVRAPPKKYFCFILLADKISLPGWFYFVRYWAICVLQLFVNQVVASWILKLTLSYQLAVFSSKAFFVIFKRLPLKHIIFFLKGESPIKGYLCKMSLRRICKNKGYHWLPLYSPV